MACISVIVPVYRVEAYLDRCVQSVLHQSFRDLELILVDDGSPDGCPALCDGYARQDGRVHVIHQKNGGLSAARNAGMDWAEAHSDSRWVTFLDSDDWIHCRMLERLLSAAEQTGASLAICDLQRVSEKTEDASLGPLQPLVLDPETAYEEHYGKCMTACCKLIDRRLLEEVRFPVGKLHEDGFVTHLLLFGASRTAVLQEPLYYYYCNPGSITRADWHPKRLEELEAHEVRLQYLRAHGYARAEKMELQILAQTVYEQAEVLAELRKPEYGDFLRDLRRQLRQALCQAKGLIPMNQETLWLWLMAYPTLPLWRLGKKLQHRYHRKKGTE